MVDKYTGETEKNGTSGLADAEVRDTVLLLHEGDAVLGNRTETHQGGPRGPMAADGGTRVGCFQ